jgi:hypothetical protein
MQLYASGSNKLKSGSRTFYRRVLSVLSEANIPFLVCGSYALEAYTKIARHTKDLDIFVRPSDFDSALQALCQAGYETHVEFSHWLGKVFSGEDFLDIIFSSGNGTCQVDDTWFSCAIDAEVFGIPVKLCPPEEIIWQKAFIMERERYDGADVAHLLLACGKDLDWPRLVDRFGPHWRLLLAHLILFGFIYPAHRSEIPYSVIDELLGRLRAELGSHPPADPLCQGTLLSRAQYLPDIEHWSYLDARLAPKGNMTPEEIHDWTAPIQDVPTIRAW